MFYLPEALKDEVMPDIQDEETWLEISKNFETRWNMPHCLGAIDGKHVRITKPPKTGSDYYNYKKFFSKVILAVVDAQKKFVYVDVGAPGSCGDATLFAESPFRRSAEAGTLNIPPPKRLPGERRSARPFPYFFVADDAFALKPWIMKPYGSRLLTEDQRTYNYRISRARMVVECAFGMLSQRFQCLLNGLKQKTDESLDSVIMCCIMLHNFLVMRNPANVNPAQDANAPPPFDPLQRAHARNIGGTQGKTYRDQLKDYVNGIHGQVFWQHDAARY